MLDSLRPEHLEPPADEDVYVAKGAAAQLFQCRAPEVLIEGGAGCVAGETELWDPVAHVGRRIDDLAARRVRPWVQTKNGPVLAEPPFVKGYAPLYRVTLSNRASCLATADHLFLSRCSGWVYVADLEPGMELLSGLPSGALRSKRTDEGSRDRCCSDFRRCGQQPPLWSGTSRASSLPGGDALGRIRAYSPVGGLASRRASSLTCPEFALPSMQDSGDPQFGETWGESLAGFLSMLGEQSRDGSDSGEHASCWFLRDRRSPSGSRPLQPSGRQGHGSSRTPTGGRASLVNQPWTDHRVLWSTVQTVEFEREDLYYDLHVPGEEHYLADGFVSHNTGKSRAVQEYVNYLCEEYAGIRVLMLRGTRKSMNEAILRDFEKDVLGEGHDSLSGSSVEHRDFYDYPNGAHIALGGLDNTDRIMSTQYDVIVVFEATDREVTMEAYNKLKSRLRHNVLPWQQIVMDCNPASEFHWLNQYFPSPNEPDETGGRCVRLLSRHEDNPSVTPQYLETLANLTGKDRDRLYLHKWVAATGQVLEDFDARIHVIDEEKVPKKMAFYWGAVDWGFHPAPGVFQVWGMDQDGKCYMVAEVYQTKRQLDWWAEVAAEFDAEFGLRRIVCDPEEPEHIEKFNDRLSTYRRRNVRKIAVKAENPVRAGLDMVRWGLRPQSVPDLNSRDARDEPQLFIVKNNLRHGVDEYLREQKKPTSTVREIPSYVYVKNEEGKPIKDEKPDPACADHGIDAMRYAMMYAWKKDRKPKKHRPMFEEGTLGHLLGHEEILKRSRYGR